MKTMLKLALMIALLGSTMIAGDMGNGNQCPLEGCQPPPCTLDCGSTAQSGETDFVGASNAISGGGDSLDNVAIDIVEGAYLFFAL